jgi:hypothetical protein
LWEHGRGLIIEPLVQTDLSKDNALFLPNGPDPIGVYEWNSFAKAIKNPYSESRIWNKREIQGLPANHLLIESRHSGVQTAIKRERTRSTRSRRRSTI